MYAEQKRKEEERKARVATAERIIEEAPASFSPEQLRLFLRLIVESMAYQFLEEAANQFTSGDENEQQGDDEVMLAALSNTTDEKLVSFALRVFLCDHVSIPHQSAQDWLTEAESVFASKKLKAVKFKSTAAKKTKSTVVKLPARRQLSSEEALACSPGRSGACFSLHLIPPNRPPLAGPR